MMLVCLLCTWVVGTLNRNGISGEYASLKMASLDLQCFQMLWMMFVSPKNKRSQYGHPSYGVNKIQQPSYIESNKLFEIGFSDAGTHPNAMTKQTTAGTNSCWVRKYTKPYTWQYYNTKALTGRIQRRKHCSLSSALRPGVDKPDICHTTYFSAEDPRRSCFPPIELVAAA